MINHFQDLQTTSNNTAAIKLHQKRLRHENFIRARERSHITVTLIQDAKKIHNQCVPK